MNKFIYLYNFNGITVLYNLHKNIYELIYKLNNYINKKILSENKLYIIINFIPEKEQFDFIKDKNIFLLHSEINFELFFNLHSLRHNYFYKNNITNDIDIKSIIDLYNKISVPFDNYPNMIMYNRRNIFMNDLSDYHNSLKSSIESIKNLDKLYNEIIQYKTIETIEYYNILLEQINLFLIQNISYFNDDTINFKEYSNLYNFEESTNIYSDTISNNIVLENVYYLNKIWFNNDKQLLELPEFYSDIEYREFKNCYDNNSIVTDINNYTDYQEITEEVMFLDYIYGFYNFGEFWDIIKRLLVSKHKNLPLFHLTHNRVTNIDYYFSALKYKYPTPYQKKERNNKLYYFHKVNISTINTGCRGFIDRNFAYNFNKLLNNSIPTDKTYNLYLARSNFGRSIQNEEKIVNILKQKYNFIVLDGKETLEETINYFTNAKVILGAHGSLMKNMIWSKKNPVFIELCPPTRANLDMYGNSKNLGFLTFFILSHTNEKEEILLNDEQIEKLFELLDKLNIN